MVFNERAFVSTETCESMPQPPVTNDLPGLERLVVPSDKKTRSFIPFGIDGTLVMISPYGEVSRMSKYIAGDNPRVICLSGPGISLSRSSLDGLGARMHWVVQRQGFGLGIRLMGDSKLEDPILEWINGRWPCIRYEIDSILVSILFTVNEGILSQQILIENPSSVNKIVPFALQLRGATVSTLRVTHGRWAPSDPHENYWDVSKPLPRPKASSLYHMVEGEHEWSPCEPLHQNRNPATKALKGEAVIAVFHDSQLLKLDGRAWALPRDLYGSSNNDAQSESTQTAPSASSGILQVAPKGTQKLTLQYELQSYGDEDSRSPIFLNVENFLKSDQIRRSWTFKEDHKFNPIFRRYLEHILCLCLVNVTPDQGEECRIPFINDVTLELGSTPFSDFYIFRYLLFIHQLLKTDDYVSTLFISQIPDPDFSKDKKFELQARIKKTCAGHLRWCFDETVFLAHQSWPAPPVTGSDTSKPDDKLSTKFFVGSLQMLKLFEFSRVFGGEVKLVKKCLQIGTTLWLEALITERDKKSRLWYKDTRETYIAWGGRHEQGSESIHLPEYRLGDLIYTWKALKSLEVMTSQFQIEKDDSPDTLQRLKDMKLRAYEVREVILQRFIYQPQGALSVNDKSVISQFNQRDLERGTAKDRSAFFYFGIAVRRSRETDRRLFYAKDAMLHDGVEWGFFENDIDIKAYGATNEPVKVDIQLAWKNTLQAQGIDHEIIWKKPLRYAMAIIMASHHVSLDDSQSADKLSELSWERLLGCVMPHGIFANQIERGTKLPHSQHTGFDQHSPWATWEVATLMLGRRFKALEVEILRDVPPPVSQEVPASQDEDNDSQPPDSSISWEIRSALIKKVVLEKRRTSSYKKVDLKRVSEPKESKAKEWLYPYPDFITKRPPYDMREEYDGMHQRHDIDLKDSSPQTKIKDILIRGFKKWSQAEAFSTDNNSATVVTVGQHNRSSPDIDWCDAEDLDILHRQPRSIRDAKKRFLFLAPLKVEDALILYMAAPSKEREHMANFYTRHSSYLSHLHEDVHPLANVWTTELHLSFFQLIEIEESPDTYFENDLRNKRKLEEAGSDDVCDSHQRAFPQILKDSKLALLKKASLSYRIVGDMDDKFWTGYLLIYSPADSDGCRNTIHWDSYDIGEWFREDRRIDQRKVLEPFVVEKMVAEMVRSIDEILKVIDVWLDPEIDGSEDGKAWTQPKVSKADDRFVDAQYSRSAICLELDATLRILRRLSKANVDSLNHWTKREQTRNFQPRWSEKDEYKFRELIDFQKRRVEQQVSRMNNQYRRVQDSIEQVRIHRQELINNINLAESRTTAHESENIRIFTYATVIFYPLSFVASLFSMQGPPNHTTTPLFLQATAIALVTTILIVFNAETLAWPIRSFRYIISNSTRKKMERTPNEFPVTWKKVLSHIKDAEEHDILHDHEMPRWPRNKMVYSLFLVVYFFVDFPTSRIVLAHESVANFKEAKFPDHATLTLVRIFIALVLLPVFAASWTILVIWSLFCRIVTRVWMLPLEKWKKARSDDSKKHIKRLKEQYEADDQAEAEAEAKEKERAREQEGARDGDRVKRNNKEERHKTVEERINETRREERKEKEDRVRKRVKLLINPPDLFKRMEPSGPRSRLRKKEKGEDEESQSQSSGLR